MHDRIQPKFLTCTKATWLESGYHETWKIAQWEIKTHNRNTGSIQNTALYMYKAIFVQWLASYQRQNQKVCCDTPKV